MPLDRSANDEKLLNEIYHFAASFERDGCKRTPALLRRAAHRLAQLSLKRGRAGQRARANLSDGRVGCYDCGLSYGGGHWVEAVVPHEIWRNISPTGDEGGILCINCIALRLAKRGGPPVPVKLTSGPFVTDREFAARNVELEAEVSLLREGLAAQGMSTGTAETLAAQGRSPASPVGSAAAP